MTIAAWVLVLTGQAAPADGTVTGVVRLGHRPPPPRTLDTRTDPSVPQGLVDNDLVLGRDNEIRGALIVIAGVLSERIAPATIPATVEIRGSQYEPRVVALRPGQPLRHVNRDGNIHNVHVYSWINPETNEVLGGAGSEATRTFSAPEERILVRCDLHPWERGTIHVFDHPFFAVTGPDGRFEIRGLPPGTYRVDVTHERCRPARATVRVEAGRTATMDFDLATEAGPPPIRWMPYAIGTGVAAALLVGLALLGRRK